MDTETFTSTLVCQLEQYCSDLEETITATTWTKVIDATEILDIGGSIVISGEQKDGFGFEIQGCLGEGGMGIVDVAKQTSLNREVAIKRSPGGENSPWVEKLLIEEAILHGQLEHPNIPPVHMLGYDSKGCPALVMRRIDGVCLKDLIKETNHAFWENVKTDRVEWLLRVLVQTCNAVDYAHSKSVLHRDIKTENIMVGPYGEVFLIDWGVAIKLDEKGENLPKDFMGSPRYAAPEMFKEKTTLTKQTDVYLLGSTLVECLTGNPIHKGKSLVELIQCEQELDKNDFPESVDDALLNICLRATRNTPEERFDSAKSFRQALELYLKQRAAINTLEYAYDLFDELEIEFNKENSSAHFFQQVAFQCRFAFEETLRQCPELVQAHEGILDTLDLMIRFELSNGKLGYAEHLFEEFQNICNNKSRVEQLQQLISKALLVRTKSDELNTQIQYKLIEKLAQKSDKG